ncbi:glycosyltransferase [candidate division GN15 bacterium]|nr:glycosyltransferase [candidate division GN15 bacterium]
MSRLSVVIITRNEEANLGRCLESVAFADEVIVVDSDSTDRTEEISVSRGAQFVTIEWAGFGPAKQAGVDRATGEWVLSIDADEAVPADLAEEITRVIADPDSLDGYYLPRRTQFLGRWIGHCGWYPDYVLRLFRRERGRFDGAVVHEKVVVDGRVGRLKHDLLHYSYPTLEEYFVKFNRYTTMGAEQAHAAGKRAGWFAIAIKPVATFFTHYVSRQGFRDGLEGFLISTLSSAAVLVKYAKLRHLRRQQES